MALRTIVHHPDRLDGRWHLEGTEIPIAEIHRSFMTNHVGPKETFRYAELSAEAVAEALAFDFPAIRDHSIELCPAMIVVHCVCGEDTTAITVGNTEAEIVCICGRGWVVRIVIEPLPVRADFVQTS